MNYGEGTYGAGTYGGTNVTTNPINLREDKSKRTKTTVTLLWDHVNNVSGFLFKRNGKIVAQGTSPDQTTTRMAAVTGDKIEIIPTVAGSSLMIS